MPIARYFLVVGGVLAALLLIAGWCLPEPPASFSDRPEIIERAAIRIRSAHKWPEKVVLDTNQPTILPPSAEVEPAMKLVERLPDQLADQASIVSPTKPKPDARPIDVHQPLARAKHKIAKVFRSNRLARARNRGELLAFGAGDECCRYGWTDLGAGSKAASRKHLERRDVWMGWHFPEMN